MGPPLPGHVEGTCFFTGRVSVRSTQKDLPGLTLTPAVSIREPHRQAPEPLMSQFFCRWQYFVKLRGIDNLESDEPMTPSKLKWGVYYVSASMTA